MNVATRLGLFAAGVVVSFGAAFAAGAAIGPDLVVEPSPAHDEPGHVMEEGEVMDHDDA